MTNMGDNGDWKSSARGESAWKETREGVATRNADARKAGKIEREGYERERDDVRRAAAAKRHAALLKSHKP
jgi:hypothetical protein